MQRTAELGAAPAASRPSAGRQDWAEVAVLRSRDWRWFSSLARKRIARNGREQNSTSDQSVRSRGFPEKQPDPEWSEQHLG